MSDRGNQNESRIAWLWRRLSRQVWLRATLFSLAAVAAAVLAGVVAPLIPYEPSLELASGAVNELLTILASSMLAVTTFSLSVMVSTYSAATSNATPRSTKLLRDDAQAQNTLSTFVGAFLFGIVGIIGLSAGLYQSRGRVLLFFATLIALLVVVAALLRWINYLGRFGRVGDIILRVEKAARDPLLRLASEPHAGGRPAIPVPADASPVTSRNVGYVQYVGYGDLQEIASSQGLVLHLSARAGSLVHPGRPLLHSVPAPTEETAARIRDCFSIDEERDFSNDPRFGLIVLSEIAERASSTAINDPGTVVEVLGSGLRLFTEYGQCRTEGETRTIHDRLHVEPLDPGELLERFIRPVLRDANGNLEVIERTGLVLRALADTYPQYFASAAVVLARRMLDRIEDSNEEDRPRIRQIAETLSGETCRP